MAKRSEKTTETAQDTGCIEMENMIFALCRHLDSINIYDHCDGTLAETEKYLKDHVPEEEIEEYIDFIQSTGGYCDCEVLLNTIDSIS